jgi:hypothetical protein
MAIARPQQTVIASEIAIFMVPIRKGKWGSGRGSDRAHSTDPPRSISFIGFVRRPFVDHWSSIICSVWWSHQMHNLKRHFRLGQNCEQIALPPNSQFVFHFVVATPQSFCSTHNMTDQIPIKTTINYFDRFKIGMRIHRLEKEGKLLLSGLCCHCRQVPKINLTVTIWFWTRNER